MMTIMSLTTEGEYTISEQPILEPDWLLTALKHHWTHLSIQWIFLQFHWARQRR